MNKNFIRPPYLGGLAILISVLLASTGQAQKLAGITNSGGPSGGGVVFRLNADGKQFVDLTDLNYYSQYAKIITSKDRTVLYGLTTAGSPQGIFSVNADGTNYKFLFAFPASSGSLSTNLLLASDDHLYGISKIFNGPTWLYRIDTDGSNFSTVAPVPGAIGYLGDLYEGTNGKLYALTTDGGASHYGSLISINKDGSGFNEVHAFSNSDGASIYAPLIQDATGTFYGVGPGGANNMGQIYKFNSDGTGFTTIHDFDGTLGQDPRGGLTLGSDGNLYGTTSAGGANGAGTFYTITPNGTGFTKLYDQIGADGSFFFQVLVEDENGFFYGCTVTGGPKAAGILFKIKSDGSEYQKIYDFDNNTTEGQFSGSIALGNNLLFGVNTFGASYGTGNIFSIKYDGTGYTSIHDFGGPDGYLSSGKLIQGIDSLIYGTTLYGGVHDGGTVFVMDGNGKNQARLFDLGGLNGSNPNDLTQANDGTLYGTTSMGGTTGVGTIFKIQPNGTSFTKLYDFHGYDGSLPFSAPLIGADGNLFGTTYGGGTSLLGNVYSCKPDGSNFTTLLSFSSANGSSPYSSLIQDSLGTLYGTTVGGGANYNGVIYSIKPNGTGFTVLHEFNSQNGDGSGAYASPVLGKDGNLYGVTYYGGTGGIGTFYMLKTDGSQYVKLYDFQTNSGYSPVGSLIEIGSGTFYGIASNGGANASGLVFSIKSDGTEYTRLFDFPSGLNFTQQNGLTPLRLRKQSINFNTLEETQVGGPPISLSANASSGLPVSFSSVTPALTEVNGNQATTLAGGKATIKASQDGDGVYDLATVLQTFCIDPSPPTISLSGGGPSPVTLTSNYSAGNQWFFNGTAVSGATNSTFNLSAPGTYTVQENIDGCYSPITPESTFLITGVEILSDDLRVFPNPTTGSLSVNLNAFDLGTAVRIEVYNTMGLLVNSVLANGGTVTNLDASQLANGLYVLTATQSVNTYKTRFAKY